MDCEKALDLTVTIPSPRTNSIMEFVEKALAGISVTVLGSVSPITVLNAPLSNPVTVIPFIVSGTYRSEIFPLYFVMIPSLLIAKFSSLSVY